MAKIKCPKCKSEVDTVSPDIEIEKDRLDLIISCPNCNQTFVTFGQDKKDEIAHETLLKELHNVDQLVETHSQIVLAILAALIAFVSSQFANGPLVYFISVFGILISLEWLLKVIRHRMMFRKSHDKLTDLQDRLGIDALRPLTKPYR